MCECVYLLPASINKKSWHASFVQKGYPYTDVRAGKHTFLGRVAFLGLKVARAGWMPFILPYERTQGKTYWYPNQI